MAEEEILSENNKCPLCKNVKETEVHFLFHCNAYNNIRQKCSHLTSISNNADQTTVASLLSCTEKSILIELARFIAEAMKHRTLKLEQSNAT